MPRTDGSLVEFRMAVERLEAETPIEGSDSLFVFVNMLPIPDSPGSFGFGGRSNECASALESQAALETFRSSVQEYDIADVRPVFGKKAE